MSFIIKKIPFDRFSKKNNTKEISDAKNPKDTINDTPNKTPNDTPNNKDKKDTFHTSTFDALPDDFLDRYQVGDAIVTITHDHKYFVYEPQFQSPEDKLAYDTIRDYKQLLRSDTEKKKSPEEILMRDLTKTAAELGLSDILTKNYKAAKYNAVRDILGYEVIDVLMRDMEHLEDITCSDYTSVGVMHRDYLEHEVLRTNIRFRSPEHLNVFLERLARMGGKHISSSEPIVDFHLGENYRVAIISDEITAATSSALSIRLKSPRPFTITEMIANKVIPINVTAIIWKMLDFHGTGLVIGGTGAGKSSMLNTLFPLLHKASKIITIEDTAELDIPQFDWTPLMITVPIISSSYNDKFQEMLNAALRHRPKMISVGEVRGRSTANLFDVMSTGHSSLASFHATNEHGAVNRIINEFGVHPASFSQLWFLLHVGAIVSKDKKHVRKCISFDEVYYDGKQINLINLCNYDAISDTFRGADMSEMCTKSKKLEYISRFDASLPLQEDLARRKSLLQECVKQKAYTPKKVMEILSRYYV